MILRRDKKVSIQRAEKREKNASFSFLYCWVFSREIAVLVTRAKRKTLPLGIFWSLSTRAKILVVNHGVGRNNRASDGNPIAPSTRRATSEVFASRIRSIDDRAAGLLLDRATWPAVDNLKSNRILV